MKKTLTVMTLLAGATVAYSQGFVSMNDYSGVPNSLEIQVFQPQPTASVPVSVNGYSGLEVMGNPANTYLLAPGTTAYSSRSTIGAGTSVGLLAVAGTPASPTYNMLSLIPTSISSGWVNSISHGNTATGGNNFGIWSGSPTASIGPGSPTTATVAIAAWQNTGPKGAATTLLAAQMDGYNWGVSAIVTTGLTVGNGAPNGLPTTLTSFSEVSVPEPSTIALGVIGASTLLFRRRK
jgi:hypothetical protein